MSLAIGSTEGLSDPEQIVTIFYRRFLRREPDRPGLEMFSAELRNGRDLEWLLQTFLQSEEFRQSFSLGLQSFPLDSAPPLSIDTGYGQVGRQEFWDHIASVWSDYGKTDPYWSVLSDERWRLRNMSQADLLAEFYATGRDETRRFDAWLARNQLAPPSTAVCAEYGCGVGRVTLWLARRFRRVIAFDISQPHLDAARDRLASEGIDNVDFVLVRDYADMCRIADIDIFYSIIVLQHNPPPMMLDILDQAFAALRPGGVAFFQVPTYSSGYAFSADSYLQKAMAERTMEMHVLPQRSVLQAGRRHGVFPVEIQPDWCVGTPSQWISNTFLFRRPS